MKKRVFLVVCVLLCALLLTGFSSPSPRTDSAGDEPLAELHLEKNGLPLDLTLQKLEIEDGKLVVKIGIDNFTEWTEEAPPKLIIKWENPSKQYKMDLFSNSTAQSMKERNAKNFAITLTYDEDPIPDQLLIDIGEDEPLVFYPQPKEAAAADSAPKPGRSLKPTPTPEPAANEAEGALKEIRRLLDREKYYDAALAIQDCYYDYPEVEDECDELYDELYDALSAKRPKTGKIERTTQYEGRNELRVHAQSGDVHIFARDQKNGQYVSYYIRQGESEVIYLPAGNYDLQAEIGDLWFDNVTGFGDFCDVEYDELEMETTSDGSWMTYTWYERTY